MRFQVSYYMQSKFCINRITGLKIVRGEQNFTQIYTRTHTPRPILWVLFFYEETETRLKDHTYWTHESKITMLNHSQSFHKMTCKHFCPKHYANTPGLVSLNLWSTECQSHRQRQDRTEHKGHALNPRIEIKISDPAGNRTRTVEFQGGDSTDHATATYN